MRLLVSTLVAITLGTSAFAGSLTPAPSHDGKVTRGTSCSGGVLVGGCSYCIGGVLYTL